MARPDETRATDGADRTAPGSAPQTIVIERRERGGLVRRVFLPILFLFLLMYLFNGLLTREVGLPTRLTERYAAGDATGPTIAIVEVDGLIMDGEVEHALRQIRQARDDDRVKAVILRIDSPGGTVSGSDRIWREVGVLKGKKPIVASLGGMAASGGYYVASAADHVLAEPTTLTGSIGVILELPQLDGLMKKLGVEMETIATGDWKDTGSPFRPMTEHERERWRELIDDAYQRFVRVVAQGRKLPLSEVTPRANGKVYTAQEALRYKLIDEIGYLDDAILEAQRRTRIEGARVIRYARQSTFESLLGVAAHRPSVQIDAPSLLRLQTPQLLFLAR
jgi:protease-4